MIGAFRCNLLGAALLVLAPLVTATDIVAGAALHGSDRDAQQQQQAAAAGGASRALRDEARLFATDGKRDKQALPASDDGGSSGVLLTLAVVGVLCALALAFLVGYYVGTVTRSATLRHARAMAMRVETSARAAPASFARDAPPPAQPDSPVPQHRHASAAVAAASYYKKQASASRLDRFRVKTMNQHN